MIVSYVDPWNKKLEKVRALRAEGTPVWYRRGDFYNDGTVPEGEMPIPKWHIAADREEQWDNKGIFTWKALCGYKYDFYEILDQTPRLKLSGKPKLAEQCTRCRNKQTKITAEANLLNHHVNTEGTTMTDQPVFTGTPDDWWEQATRITNAEAEERSLGNWYITLVRTAGNTKPGYRLSTPSKPPNSIRRGSLNKGESERVRRITTGVEEVPTWMTSVLVIADTVVDGEVLRLPWIRKASGRWQSLTDGRLNINDHAMAELSPNPATITEDLI